jgi:hypothetical protein
VSGRMVRMPVLNKTASGQHHFTYEGPCGVSGVDQIVSFSLEEVYSAYLQNDGDALVRDQGLMEIQALSAGIAHADFLDILPAEGVPEEWRVKVSSDSENATIRVRLHLPHSISR